VLVVDWDIEACKLDNLRDWIGTSLELKSFFSRGALGKPPRLHGWSRQELNL
jgi:hypothetical protein